ncbi:uncharacterized protein BJ171DRAFT_508489 [Polychytrium aggregatum]|uniref:uncharacterized protein n=1 Tax=Polychytrium aggregatum TaxID=110093 RepID=UPI0022FDE046|nr:uncharacterized protein BJ171DRAFT_508489 [Polychytrium aggregatum]KAI9203868.1 hypothetical protein BJ171DRAFT_508489 [Polychytrium aggregatum]
MSLIMDAISLSLDLKLFIVLDVLLVRKFHAPDGTGQPVRGYLASKLGLRDEEMALRVANDNLQSILASTAFEQCLRTPESFDPVLVSRAHILKLAMLLRELLEDKPHDNSGAVWTEAYNIFVSHKHIPNIERDDPEYYALLTHFKYQVYRRLKQSEPDKDLLDRIFPFNDISSSHLTMPARDFYAVSNNVRDLILSGEYTVDQAAAVVSFFDLIFSFLALTCGEMELPLLLQQRESSHTARSQPPAVPERAAFAHRDSPRIDNAPVEVNEYDDSDNEYYEKSALFFALDRERAGQSPQQQQQQQQQQQSQPQRQKPMQQRPDSGGEEVHTPQRRSMARRSHTSPPKSPHGQHHPHRPLLIDSQSENESDHSYNDPISDSEAPPSDDEKYAVSPFPLHPKFTPLVATNSPREDRKASPSSRQIVRRRKSRPWTQQEVQALEDGIRIHGTSWRKILEMHGKEGTQILADRSQVNLKDRARTEKRLRLKNNQPLGPFEIIQC